MLLNQTQSLWQQQLFNNQSQSALKLINLSSNYILEVSSHLHHAEPCLTTLFWLLVIAHKVVNHIGLLRIHGELHGGLLVMSTLPKIATQTLQEFAVLT